MNKLGGIGILGILAIVAGAFFVLNYFNVISLSQLTNKNTPSPTPSTNLTLTCPTKTKPCNGELLYDFNKKFIGVGFHLPKGFNFYASSFSEIIPKFPPSSFIIPIGFGVGKPLL